MTPYEQTQCRRVKNKSYMQLLTCCADDNNRWKNVQTTTNSWKIHDERQYGQWHNSHEQPSKFMQTRSSKSIGSNLTRTITHSPVCKWMITMPSKSIPAKLKHWLVDDNNAFKIYPSQVETLITRDDALHWKHNNIIQQSNNLLICSNISIVTIIIKWPALH